MPTALLFPGQGSQTAHMRELVRRHEPELLELALAETDADPFEHADAGTVYAQPAIYCASLASWSGAGRPRTPFYAGHSLGELGALAAAGSIAVDDGLRLAVVRGRAMQDAASSDPGGMLALLGDADVARGLTERCGAVVANDNGPTQIVASGSVAALDPLAAEAKTHGLRALPVAVKGPFHSPAMQSAVAPYRAALATVEIRPPTRPVFSSVTAAPFGTEPDGIRDQLAQALVRPVRWRETLERLHRLGVRRFVEAAPGRVLTRLARRAFDDIETATLAEPEVARA